MGRFHIARPDPVNKTDHFAEGLAEGLSVEAAAAAVGWTNRQGNAALQRIRSMLGRERTA